VFRLNEVFRAIRTGRWTLLVGLLVGLALAAGLNATAVRTYASSTELFVSVTRTPDAPSAYQGSLFTQERMDSYARLLTTAQLAQQVVDDLGIPLTANQVVAKVNAIPLPKTDILEVTVTDTSPERAQAIADSLGRQFARQVATLETSDVAQGPTVEVRPIEPATFEPATVSPGMSRYLAVGAALGLMVGLGIVLLRQRGDRTVRGTDDARTTADTTTVTRIFENKALAKPPLVAHLEGPSATAKSFRALRLTVENAGATHRTQVVVVTSAAPGEGKSTVAVGLAVSLARSGSRVLLVEGNLWRPRLTPYLGLAASETGLTDALTGVADVGEVTSASSVDGLSVLPAGPMPEDPGELLGSTEMRALVDSLRESYDYVVIDTPALLPLVDGAAVSAFADGVLLVTRFGRTRRDELGEAATALSAVDARLLGVVLNRVPASAAMRAERQKYKADSARLKTMRLFSRSGHQPPPTDQEATDALPAASGRP
jgi:receptor protein-tyrosine kinase